MLDANVLNFYDVERRRTYTCRHCSRTGAEALFTVYLQPRRCDDCLNTRGYRSRLYRVDSRVPWLADLTIGDWLDLLVEHGYRCAYCREHVARCVLHRDHVLPLARGGQHTKANVVPACRPCNGRKTDQPPVDIWRPYRP